MLWWNTLCYNSFVNKTFPFPWTCMLNIRMLQWATCVYYIYHTKGILTEQSKKSNKNKNRFNRIYHKYHNSFSLEEYTTEIELCWAARASTLHTFFLPWHVVDHAWIDYPLHILASGMEVACSTKEKYI